MSLPRMFKIRSKIKNVRRITALSKLPDSACTAISTRARNDGHPMFSADLTVRVVLGMVRTPARPCDAQSGFRAAHVRTIQILGHHAFCSSVQSSAKFSP